VLTGRSPEPYARISPVRGKPIRVHRLIYEAHYGPLPEGMIVHHKNGDPRDNRPENLEAMTQADHLRYHKPRRPVIRRFLWCQGCGKALNPSAVYYGHKRCRHCARLEDWRIRREQSA
jgi:hypothetical protein